MTAADSTAWAAAASGRRDRAPWREGESLGSALGGGPATSVRAWRPVHHEARGRRPTGPPEDSVAMRVVVACAVEVAIAAVVAQRGRAGAVAVAVARAGAGRVLVLLPAPAPPNLLLKVALAVGAARRARAFLGDVRGVARRRGAHPARVAVPVGAGAARVRRAAAARPRVLDGLEHDPHRGGRRALAVDVVPGVPAAVGGARRRVAVAVVAPARRRGHDAGAGADTRGSAPRRARPRSARPRPPRASRSSRPRSCSSRCRGCPGGLVRTPPFSLAGNPRRSRPSTAPSRTRASAPPGSGVVDFSSDGYPGFSDVMDLRARGRLSDDIVFRVRAQQAALWRAEVFDRTTGAGGRTDDETEPLPSDGDGLSVAVPADVALRNTALGGGSSRVVQTFYLESDQPNVLFAAASARAGVLPRGGLRVDAAGRSARRSCSTRGSCTRSCRRSRVSTPGCCAAAPGDRAAADARPVPAAARRRCPPASGSSPTRITRGRATPTTGRSRCRPGCGRTPSTTSTVPREPDGRRRGRPLPVRDAARVLRTHRERDGGAAARAGVPARIVTGYGRGSATRSPATSRCAVRRARVGRGLIPGHRLDAVRPDVRRAGAEPGVGEPVHGGAEVIAAIAPRRRRRRAGR